MEGLSAVRARGGAGGGPRTVGRFSCFSSLSRVGVARARGAPIHLTWSACAPLHWLRCCAGSPRPAPVILHPAARGNFLVAAAAVAGRAGRRRDIPARRHRVSVPKLGGSTLGRCPATRGRLGSSSDSSTPRLGFTQNANSNSLDQYHMVAKVMVPSLKEIPREVVMIS